MFVFFVFKETSVLQHGPNWTASLVDQLQRRHVNELVQPFGLRLGKQTGCIYGLGEATVTLRQPKHFWLRLWGHRLS